MSLIILQTYTACGPNLNVSFVGTGGIGPYNYSVVSSPTAAGGTINSTTGIYTSPSLVNASVNNAYDVIQVTDSTTPTPLVAIAQILVALPLMLFCDVLQTSLGLPNGRIYVWDQKIAQPTDYNLYIAVSVLSSRPFGNTNFWNGATNENIQSINVLDVLQIDLISRGPAARDQKANVLMALNSIYSEQQQEFNSFKIGNLPLNGIFNNLSSVDGAAIPYRFQIQVSLQYFTQIIQSVPYYATFNQPTVITNP